MVMRTIAIVALVALAGCATTGREISSAQMTSMEKGKTTYAEVVARLGNQDAMDHRGGPRTWRSHGEERQQNGHPHQTLKQGSIGNDQSASSDPRRDHEE